jgi:hypothetical protein
MVDKRAVLAPIVVQMDHDEEVVVGGISNLFVGLGFRIRIWN